MLMSREAAIPDLLTPNNTLATTEKDKANTLNNFFLSQSSTDSPSDPIYKLCPPPLPTSARLCEIQVSPAEVYSALSSLKEKKAAGIDGLPNSLLKVAAPAICFSLAALFNNSLLAGKLPRDWKRANVRAIYKGGPKHLPDNYRPISLLSSVTKVLESLVNKSLSNFLSANNLISPFQSGFRRGDSAPLQLFRLTTELFAAVDSRAVAAAVFYDFKKAFDSVWHRALIGKLFSAGVSGSALEWLSDFITDRTQHVQVGDSLSNPALALQLLVFPKVPLSAQRFSFFSLILLHLAHPVQQTASQMTPAQSHLACHSSPLNKKSNPTSQL